MDARTIIDVLETRYGSSREAAQAIQVPFTRYLEWILDPESMPRQVKLRLMAFAGMSRIPMSHRSQVTTEGGIHAAA